MYNGFGYYRNTLSNLPSNRAGTIFVTNIPSSGNRSCQALSEYEEKKDKEKAAIHAEIKRISLEGSLI